MKNKKIMTETLGLIDKTELEDFGIAECNNLKCDKIHLSGILKTKGEVVIINSYNLENIEKGIKLFRELIKESRLTRRKNGVKKNENK